MTRGRFGAFFENAQGFRRVPIESDFTTPALVRRTKFSMKLSSSGCRIWVNSDLLSLANIMLEARVQADISPMPSDA